MRLAAAMPPRPAHITPASGNRSFPSGMISGKKAGRLQKLLLN
jgi:hypothetical protein